ncbi:MAG: SPOR domain-containing protein [Gammaproteobacteria bacterium]
MRSLFILLLLANLSYLLWGVAFSDKTSPAVTDNLSHGQQTLTLLSEQASNIIESANKSKSKFDKTSKANEEVEKNLSPSMAPAKTCYSLGPILDEKDSKKLEQRLKQTGFKPKHKAITDKEPKSYWVYFPVEKTLGDAKAVVEQLRVANVDDFFIVRKGKYTNAISLGLYNGYSRAKIRVGRLRRLGFNPKVQTRYRDVTRHWLDFQETDSKRLNTDVWEKVQKDNPLQKLARPCPDLLPKES